MTVFIQVLLPIFGIFAAGFGVQKWRKLDVKSISTFAIYILTPALVFRTFYTATLDEQYLMITLFAFALLFILIGVNKIYAKLRCLDQSMESGLILSTAFMNAGNYGTPIILFVFGEQGFTYAVSFLVLQSMIMNFFGVYYAARGRQTIVASIQSVLKMPLTYTLLLALIMNELKIPLTRNIFSAIDLLAEAAIPVSMLILGMQLAELKVDHLSANLSHTIVAIFVRLIGSPLIAFGLVSVLPMEPLLQKVLIILTATPTAVTTTMYALQFDSRPKLVSSIALFTTLLSSLSLSILLTLIG
ncbi:AEC family transporter [Cytobacillus spongiae]|uniref:AEC family transporter n=1 Tax=Cytobacillus spongiae TaxID=2901381 RepID=UPI001F4001E9|nr:AEC family transporter [Cytobacillus spongiae]UII57722.1 AEC family transporter [Cytobacillus spongiae]